jgi:hypothetical protein
VRGPGGYLKNLNGWASDWQISRRFSPRNFEFIFFNASPRRGPPTRGYWHLRNSSSKRTTASRQKQPFELVSFCPKSHWQVLDECQKGPVLVLSRPIERLNSRLVVRKKQLNERLSPSLRSGERPSGVFGLLFVPPASLTNSNKTYVRLRLRTSLCYSAK